MAIFLLDTTVIVDAINVTWEIARRAGELKNEWAKKGQTIALPDVTIAAVALANGLTLVTDNKKHFPMPEVLLLPEDGQTAGATCSRVSASSNLHPIVRQKLLNMRMLGLLQLIHRPRIDRVSFV